MSIAHASSGALTAPVPSTRAVRFGLARNMGHAGPPSASAGVAKTSTKRSAAKFLMGTTLRRFARRAGDWAARRATGVRRLFRKGPAEGWGDATLKFRNRVIGLVRHRWGRLTVTSLVGHLSLYAVLVVTLRAIGVSEAEVGWIEIMAVFAFVRLLTAIPLTPGGLGIIGVVTGAVIAITISLAAFWLVAQLSGVLD